MTHQIDNGEAYHTVQWILDNADMGFFIVTAPHQTQHKIADLYTTSRVAVYDYSLHSGAYSYSDLSVWSESQKDKDVFFILNMQNAFTGEKDFDEKFMAAFNMSRDLLAQKQKIWLFFMTKELQERLCVFARDVYSYVRLKAHFEPEEESDFEGQHILEFEERHSFSQIKKTLARYKDMEERYMAMPLEDTPREQLLSAALTLSNIATLYKDCAEYDNALRLFEKIKKIREQVLGKEHPDTATTYNNIAGVYYKQGNYAKALEWYEKALIFREKALGTKHPDTATTYNDAAGVYYKQRNYAKALEWYEKALGIREEMLSTEHPDTATTYNNIAGIYYKQRNYAEALKWYKKALAIREKVLGTEHPFTAITYSNITLVYSTQGDYAKALEWHQKALDISEKVLGVEHPFTATTYNNIAGIYNNQGDYVKALEWFQKALAIREKVLGAEHPSTATIYNNIAAVKFKQEKLTETSYSISGEHNA